jgi:hypothetical protein
MLHAALVSPRSSSLRIEEKKVKISLLQAMEAHRVVRG